MDDLLKVYEAFKTGGPAALAAIFASVWWLEYQRHKELRKSYEALQERLLDLAITTTETNTKMEAALVSLKDILAQVLNRL